ncbi:hypothetical protein IFM89_023431 [Coptis chinensis]|uniref:DUF1664 domain-containing protein n=1 Tax=Coptis chinensis TaxID=261450 RepID=A0A835MAK8_9MAGN|nr:hypothetical protein IFM89_023431 [Coptis chinensis]
MAMQTAGIGFTKLIILVGAGYTGTIVLKNNKLSDLLGELQSLVKGIEKTGDSSSNADTETLAEQVRRLAQEIRNIGPSRQITILNGDSGWTGNMANLAVPTLALGAVGYGYMWWKGLKLSDLMYVTKKSMATAVASMTKHLEQVSTALAATKRHLTQRIENLDGKLDEQKEMSKLIKNEVTEVRGDLSQIGYDLDSLHRLVTGLDGKILSLEGKQDYANAGVYYLVNFVGAKDEKISEYLKLMPKPNKPRGYIGFPETQDSKGLKQIADTLKLVNGSATDTTVQDNIGRMDSCPRSLTRFALDSSSNV